MPCPNHPPSRPTRRPRRHNTPWTPADEAVLARAWGLVPQAQIAHRLGRTVTSVRSHAHDRALDPETHALALTTVACILGVSYQTAWGWIRAGLITPCPPRAPHHPWRVRPAALEAFIRAHPERVYLPGMDRTAFPEWYAYARQHAGPAQGHAVKRPWTAREDAYLRNNCQQKTMAQMAAYLNRPARAISMRLWRLRQAHPLMAHKRCGPGSGGGGPHRPWTAAEDTYVRAHLGRPRRPDEPGFGLTITLREVAAALGRPSPGVKRHAAALRHKAARAADESLPTDPITKEE